MHRTRAVMGFLGAVCAAVLMAGCEGDTDDGPKGTGTIEGRLLSVAPQVPAAVQGITVDLSGPVNRSTVTAADGVFKFENLPAGDYRLVFHVDGKTVERTVTLADGQNLVYASVTISPTGDVNIELTAGDDDSEEVDDTDVFDLADAWTFYFDTGVETWAHGATITQSGKLLTGTMTVGTPAVKRSMGYSLTGKTHDSSVEFQFTHLPSGSGMEVIIDTATGHVEAGGGIVTAVVVGGKAGYMYGTWVGTLGESGTWEAICGVR